MSLRGTAVRPQAPPVRRLGPAMPAHAAITPAADGGRRKADFRRAALALGAFLLLPPALVVAFVAFVDPYYLLGSPSWPGVNMARPYYEPRVYAVKPYQVWRLHPEAVALGSSRVEVGIDPRHPGWGYRNVFNFAMPSSNSYAVMLAFLHAQAVGAPLRQAVVGLDFFAFNIYFPLASDLVEDRFAGGASADFAAFLEAEHPDRRAGFSVLRPSPPTMMEKWSEALYLAVNPDVAAAIARKEFKSGRDHYVQAGRAEHRLGGIVPPDWDETAYLQINPDVAAAVSEGRFLNGYHHYLAAGRAEGRLTGRLPAGWDEERYLAANPEARIRIMSGVYRDGYIHYAHVGRRQGLVGGMPAADPVEDLRVRWPALNRAAFRFENLLGMVFSETAVEDAASTILHQTDGAAFDGLGMRVWSGREEQLRALGGAGKLFHDALSRGIWRPILVLPSLKYCFGNPQTGMTMFDPYRFMLRRAYAQSTDLRLYVTPMNAARRTVVAALGLGERYDYWLRELVRINEEEAARAGGQPLPLWDFSDVNSITSEPFPAADDAAPMRWFWEFSHYRKATGDLILDRVLGYTDPARPLPTDFGVRLDGATIDAHLAHAQAGLAAWAATNTKLAAEIEAAVRNPKGLNRQAEAICW
jgi:hypothetical protein